MSTQIKIDSQPVLHYDAKLLLEAKVKQGKSWKQLERELESLVGREASLTDWTIQQVVRGKVRDPHVSVLRRVCWVLNVDLLEVMR